MNCACCLSNLSIDLEFEIVVDEQNVGYYLCAECAKEFLEASEDE